MKKAAVLSIAAFYLLLTTGMFVCLVNCTAEIILSKKDMHMAAMPGMHHTHDSKKDCDCCKKHANYLVKENLKPGFDVRFSQVCAWFTPLHFAYIDLYKPDHYNVAWQDSNAPPPKSGKTLSIQYRSLLI